MNHSTLYEKIKKVLDLTLTEEQNILIWVSWWPDSMYLLSCLQTRREEKKRQQTSLHIVSCDHNTRENTKNEIQTVQKKTMQNTFYSTVYNGNIFSESALRERRHQIFIDYCLSHNIKTILLWHHLDDRIETTFLNLNRGAGIQWILGLWVITPHFLNKTINIVRPLLFCTKNQINKECKKNNIYYHEDPTNNDIDYSKRNKMRVVLNKYFNTTWFYKSMSQLYERLEQKENIAISIRDQIYNKQWKWFWIHPDIDNQYIISIKTGERDSDLLYKVYAYHYTSINPRSTTLDTFVTALNQKSWNKISYNNITIQSFHYSSVIKINK